MARLAGLLKRDHARQGVTLATTDATIAAVALYHDVQVAAKIRRPGSLVGSRRRNPAVRRNRPPKTSNGFYYLHVVIDSACIFAAESLISLNISG
jgi:hypothetical protein